MSLASPSAHRLSWRDTSPDVVLAMGVCPLIAVSDTLINALGLGLVLAIVTLCTQLAALLLARFPTRGLRLAATALLVMGLTCGVMLFVQAWLPSVHQSLGIFPYLIVANVVLLMHFIDIDRSALHRIRRGLWRLALIAVILAVLGVSREWVGRGSILYGAGQLFGAGADQVELQWFRADMGFLLAMLPPGAFIALGLLLAMRNWWAQRRSPPTT